jgi:hypothetical protein
MMLPGTGAEAVVAPAQLAVIMPASATNVKPVTSGSMTTALDSLPKLGAPATRALNAAGYSSLRQLAGIPRSGLARLHGMGPKALRIIEEQLEQHGLALG